MVFGYIFQEGQTFIDDYKMALIKKIQRKKSGQQGNLFISRVHSGLYLLLELTIEFSRFTCRVRMDIPAWILVNSQVGLSIE